ncbi:Protoporphyrinogen oxidase [Sporobacter termitidis DSM 10068]|uniref:Protoporphyrinogen oxidase n=1 Tax=Sporobacter termitidis DSM 10068 TaxID=1123282 RepID=A0A1M5WTX6_9FIRM|nr:NAD(P)/FAD-dependent oxidoreductase [Sporobacter termitidis]SHH90890.1 Protoporphyrinogen oxidase [Sporobacter termitidis DSM 10068]
MADKTAIIIGAGPAGLTAAYKLLTDTDIKPIVLEETGFIGGISRTAEYHGNRMDLGGHRFFSKNEEIMNLWREIMPLQGTPARDDTLLDRKKPLAPGGPDPEKTDRVMLVRNRVSRIFYLRKFFDYPISLKAQTFINMGFSRTMMAGFGYMRSAIFKRKEESLGDFYINRFGKPLYEMFFEDYTEKVWGVHPGKISPDWGAQRVKGLSLSKAVLSILKKPFVGNSSKNVETSLIEEFNYPKKGPGQLWEQLAELVREKGGEIRMNTRVTEIHGENGHVAAVTAAGDDGEATRLTGDYFLSSMPVKDLVCGMCDVPANVREVAEALPYRDFITVGLLLKRLEIKNETKMKTVGNIVPDCWIYVQERDVKLGRLQIFNNWSPYMVEDLENTIFVGLEYFCNEGDDMWTMPDEKFIEFAIGELEKIDVIRRENVLDSVRINVKKAYPAYFGSYARFGEVRDFLDTFDNLYCIGRNGQHKYNNMDHSMLTAIEAVAAICGNKKSKNDIWNVNTETEYHETKSGA